MADDFDRKWTDLLTRRRWVAWVDTIYALIGLTRFGERSTTVEQLAAVLDRPEEETMKLAWEASRVRPDEEGRIQLNTPFAGGPSRRKVYVGERELAVSGCAPDLFQAAAVLDVPFRVDDTCSATGAPIRVQFTPDGLAQVDPPEAVVAMVSPEVAGEYEDAEIEQRNQNLCSQSPFFSSAQAAKGWLEDHPGGRIFSIEEMLRRPFITHLRDTLRPRILAHAESLS